MQPLDRVFPGCAAQSFAGNGPGGISAKEAVCRWRLWRSSASCLSHVAQSGESQAASCCQYGWLRKGLVSGHSSRHNVAISSEKGRMKGREARGAQCQYEIVLSINIRGAECHCSRRTMERSRTSCAFRGGGKDRLTMAAVGPGIKLVRH